MLNIFKYIYHKEDKGVYRIRTIFGIKITTKPYRLQLEERIKKLEELESLNIISNLEIYKKYKNNARLTIPLPFPGLRGPFGENPVCRLRFLRCSATLYRTFSRRNVQKLKG